jgi:hypothetical protein
MRNAFLFLAALSVLAAAQEPPRRHGCGMSRNLERIASAPFGTAVGARTAAGGSLSGRTLVTAHFALHYTLGWNVHQPVWTTADAALKAKRDSLYNIHKAANPARRDSLINAGLDALAAPHPAYVTNAAAYFENAWSYFGDSLGMRMPDSNEADVFRNTVAGKFNVDIGDIDLLQNFDGTYGLTFPPSAPYSASMLLDNDFLYNASVNGTSGAVAGTPIVNPATGVNYNLEWDKGLAVTIAHEFYHAVQFEYSTTRTGSCYHSWYELGAVAMEERLAPAVNDYLGYLHDVLRVRQVSLLESCGTNANYGNGIFHIFLSRALGKAFDAVVWEALRANGNNLPAALVTAAGSQARWDSLYAAYAAAITLSGSPGAAASPLAFSPDVAAWPRPLFDTALAKTASTLSLGRATYRLVSPVPGSVTWASYPGIPGAWRVSLNGSTFSSQFLGDTLVPLSSNGALGLAVANGSFALSRSLTLTRGASSEGVAAFPNPARRSGQIHFSGPESGSNATLVIVSESGKRAATLEPDPTGSFWTWNFRDAQNRALPPGVYYYGLTGEAPQALLVLP